MLRVPRARLLFTVLAIALLASVEATEQDDVTWNGQYYTGQTFHQGTYEFAFGVYNASTGGTVCFQNTTNITTGALGEWTTQQHAVGERCNASDGRYWLDIAIAGVPQPPRRRITVGEFIRRDADITIDRTVTFTGNVVTAAQLASDMIINNTLTVESNTNSYFGGLTVRNNNSGSQAAGTLYVENDDGQFVSLAIASSGYAPLEPNMGGLLYAGNESFVFGARNDSNDWHWRTYYITPTLSGISFNPVELMSLDTAGNLILDHGNLVLQGSDISGVSTLTATTDVCLASGNCLSNAAVADQTLRSSDSVTFADVTAGVVWASAVNATEMRVTGDVCIDETICLSGINRNLFDQNLNTDSDVAFGTLEVGAISVEGNAGITDAASFTVCLDNFAGGTCNSFCTLDIHDGIIVGCN